MNKGMYDIGIVSNATEGLFNMYHFFYSVLMANNVHISDGLCV